MEHSNDEPNIYLRMPLERVKADAEYGVTLARLALAERDPDAARAIGIGIPPKHERLS